MSLNIGEKAERADVNPNHRRPGPGRFSGDAKHGAVAPENDEEIHRPGQGGGIRTFGRLQSGQ